MKLFEKIKSPSGRRRIYFCGVKVFSYKRKSRNNGPQLLSINKVEFDAKIALFNGLGIREQNETPRIIVSLTSFPQRMYDIHYALYSLLTQSYKPDMVVLWLAEEQFPRKEADIPQEVLRLKENGLTIKWCHDSKSYKKLIPSLHEFPHDIIVTADDDVYYASDWLEHLVDAYKEEPQYIHCHRAHLIQFFPDGSLQPYVQWKFDYKDTRPSFKHFFTGVGGILYPPQSLDNEVLREDVFQKLAPYADDVWFWTMALKKGTKVKIIPNHRALVYINLERELRQNGELTLMAQNVVNGGNDVQLASVLRHYDLYQKFNAEL